MSERRPLVRKLAESILASGGKIPLAVLLENAVPVRDLRSLARKSGLSPKGFRVDRAPARVLAPLLAEVTDPDILDDVVTALLDAIGAAERKVAAADKADEADEAGEAEPALGPVLKLREQELAEARRQVERARTTAERARRRAAELERELGAAGTHVARLRGELDQAQRRQEQQPEPAAADRDQTRRIHELERDLEAFAESEGALRRLLALRMQRIRDLDEQVAELNELLPKGRRRRKRAPEPAPEASRRFILPHFSPGFYKSLEAKDRRSVERGFQAILLFCTEGHSYPGLEAKQLGGQDLWSLRASLRLRVYFQNREDGDVDVLALADREDQNTTLRRLKER